MAGVDLGKQYGPLPLGAWIVVVGAGLGIALWTRRTQAEPEVVEDGSGTPGVGAGGSGMFTELVPVTGGSGTIGKPTTNEEWGVLAINWLIANNYPANQADSAVRKYLAGVKMSVGEYTMIGKVLAALGAPPQVLPPAEEDPPPTDPPPTNPPPTEPPPTSTKLPAPKNLRQTDGVKYTDRVMIAWDSVPGAVGYVLHEVTNQAGGWTQPVSVGPVTAYTKTGLVHYGSYWVRIAAIGPGEKQGNWSGNVLFRTKN